MEILNELTHKLNDIKKISIKIIKKGLKVMKELEDEDNDIVEEFIDQISEEIQTKIVEKEIEKKGYRGKDVEDEEIEIVKTRKANKILRNVSLAKVEDSENIIKEIESFSDAVRQGEEAIEEGEKEFPFFCNVWYGDMYDEENIAGLKILLKDLEKQFSKINSEDIIKTSLSKINKEFV